MLYIFIGILIITGYFIINKITKTIYSNNEISRAMDKKYNYDNITNHNKKDEQNKKHD